ncbi:hypothetical protein [Bacillus suaedae]|nr:hypothetical protein [Bacillus suaedae]
MPLVRMKRIWTPLTLIGIKLSKDDEGSYYVRFWSSNLKKIS